MSSKTQPRIKLPGTLLLQTSGILYIAIGIIGLINLYFINIFAISEFFNVADMESISQSVFSALITINRDSLLVTINSILLISALYALFMGFVGIFYSKSTRKSVFLQIVIIVHIVASLAGLVYLASVALPEIFAGGMFVLTLIPAAFYFIGSNKNGKYIPGIS